MDKFKLTYDWWEAILEIDGSKDTIRVMEDQLLFWMGGQERIDDEDGDIVRAYLKMLCTKLLLLSMDWNIDGINHALKESEGWALLDGSFGVKLVSVDRWELSEGDFFIEKEGVKADGL